jgi:hypothetical protein
MRNVRDPLLFQRELLAASRALGLVPRLVSAHPEQWRLGPLSLHVDRARGTCELRYARAKVISRIPLRGASVMRAWRRARKLLMSSSQPPDELLPRLLRVYARMAKPGERVQLRELVRRLRLSRAQAAFDLARLRHERRLQFGGWRIDLGVATGIVDPKRVVWIEDEFGSGHYYQYFRMLGGRDERADTAPGAQDSQPDGRKRETAGARRHARQRR